MSEEMIFSSNESIVSNLDRLAKEHSIISEQRLLELYGIAYPMAQTSLSLIGDGLDVYEVLSLISESITLGQYSLSEDTVPEHTAHICGCLAALRRTDKAVLTEIYLRCISELGISIDEGSFLPSVKSEETFTYVRNGFSDEAYDVFSQDFLDPKVRYASSFRECARAVTSGEVTYCLLPLEEKGGVRLPTVSEIVFRNDFKINSVIPVFGQDGTADMKYALVSKSFSVPKRGDDDDLYLEIRVEADADLAEIFGAVYYFGMKTYRVNTVTFDTEGESETYFSVVVKDSGIGFTPLLTYLTLFVRDFVPVGMYKNLE